MGYGDVRARRLSLVLSLAPAVAVWAAVAAPAGARTGPCVIREPGPDCDVWTGRVAWVDDGDTVDVDVDGDGTRRPLRVRITGIQAMEQTSYRAARRRGDCHAVEATRRLERLVREAHGRARLAAQDVVSESRGRAQRSLAVRIHGRWQDVGRVLLAEGLALWWPGKREDAWNARYSALAQKAALARVGLYNSSSCGLGPSEGAPFKLWVNADADGPDAGNLEDEWVRIRNLDPVNALPLGGWWVRDSALRRFTLPPTAAVPPGGELTVHVGPGVDSASDLHWGLRVPAFENPSRGDEVMGDGAYLFDPQGDLRAWMIYPCRYRCAAPGRGSLTVSAHPSGREYVTVGNAGTAPIALEDYRLDSGSHSYTFGPDAVLGPGDTVRIDVEGDPSDDTPRHRHWGQTGPILRNAGGTVRLATFEDIGIACADWGDDIC